MYHAFKLYSVSRKNNLQNYLFTKHKPLGAKNMWKAGIEPWRESVVLATSQGKNFGLRLKSHGILITGNHLSKFGSTAGENEHMDRWTENMTSPKCVF